jgi:hypothetical protein
MLRFQSSRVPERISGNEGNRPSEKQSKPDYSNHKEVVCVFTKFHILFWCGVLPETNNNIIS